MSPCFKPRWYQTDAVHATLNYFINGGTGHPLVVCPTGAGKSHILGIFCAKVLAAWPDQQILILSHVAKIVEQDAAAVAKHVPADQVGVFAAGLGRKERRRVTVGSIQTVARNPHFFRGVNIILVDECHRIPHGDVGQYREFLALFSIPVVGLTATHFRLGRGYLHEGDGALFTDIAYEVDIVKLLDQGFLTWLVARDPEVEMDTSGVRKAGGDFVGKALSDKFDRDGLTTAICDDLMQYRQYGKWLIFAIDIQHANHVHAALAQRSISSAIVHSKQTPQQNQQATEDFEAGRVRGLISIETLTTGYDCPEVDLIALLRPTSSPVLHIQMLGRGLRVVYADGYDLDTVEGRLAAIANGPKPFCCVRDYAGNIKRLGPINDVHVKPPGKKGGGEAVTKVCPQCKLMVHGSCRVCPDCGHEFQFEQKLTTTASTEKIIDRKKKEPPKVTRTWHEVETVAYGVHVGATQKATLLVQYACRDGAQFTEYKLFAAGTRAQYISAAWWRKRSVTKKPVPVTVQEAHRRAMEGELVQPARIEVETGQKYPEVKRAEMQ